VPDILNTIRVAFGLLAGFDTTLLHIVGLSLAVSLSASGAAMVCGLPMGAALAVFRFPGAPFADPAGKRAVGVAPGRRRPGTLSLHSRSGPLGILGILFTPTAMVIAQFRRRQYRRLHTHDDDRDHA
jgi:tungstate transport system permease protein